MFVASPPPPTTGACWTCPLNYRFIYRYSHFFFFLISIFRSACFSFEARSSFAFAMFVFNLCRVHSSVPAGNREACVVVKPIFMFMVLYILCNTTSVRHHAHSNHAQTWFFWTKPSAVGPPAAGPSSFNPRRQSLSFSFFRLMVSGTSPAPLLRTIQLQISQSCKSRKIPLLLPSAYFLSRLLHPCRPVPSTFFLLPHSLFVDKWCTKDLLCSIHCLLVTGELLVCNRDPKQRPQWSLSIIWLPRSENESCPSQANAHIQRQN